MIWPGVDVIYILTLFFLSLQMHKHTGQQAKRRSRSLPRVSIIWIISHPARSPFYAHQHTGTSETDEQVRCERRNGKRRARWEGRVERVRWGDSWLCEGLC